MPANRPGPIMVSPDQGLPEFVHEDLARSGLVARDIRVGYLDATTRHTINVDTNAPGYVIPYFKARGGATGFYRVKMITSSIFDKSAKYKQPPKTNNHIYFPPGFYECVVNWCRKYPKQGVLVITEGEKKAACAVKMGIPCVGLGGVDSWRTRTIEMSPDTEVTRTKDKIKAKLPKDATRPKETQTLAEGFDDMLEIIDEHQLTPVLIFDSDYGGKVRNEVQKAVALLAYELRHQGIPSSRLKQIILPDLHNTEPVRDADDIVIAGPKVLKSGLDDYLMEVGAKPLIDQLLEVFHDPTKFPRHPNSKGYLSVKLNELQDRKLSQQLGHIIMAELDADGIRIRDAFTGLPYYYNRETYKLMPATILSGKGTFLHESAFGTLLYQKFGVGAADIKVLNWVATQYTGEAPIIDVVPRKVRTLITEKEDPTNPNGIAIQAGDSQFFAISPDPKNPIRLHVNGDLGLLFQQDQVEPVDVDEVLEAFDQINAEEGPLVPWWLEVLQDTNIGRSLTDLQLHAPGKNPGEVDEQLIPISPGGQNMRKMAALLYYVAPYLQRWRGIQLPVEIMIGGPGSGKSSLYEMRLGIMSGRPYLRNLPNDIKDWYASLANSGGLHVTDNVHFSKGDLKQRISDEICRLTTEPVPTIEVRQLYTTADLARFPIDITFGFTAVAQPFQNADLFSRAMIFETCNLGKPPDSDWVKKKLAAYGGRALWMAHILVFLHRFLREASKPAHEGGWNEDFNTAHRLAHLEQAFTIASKVLGLDTSHLRSSIREIQHNASIDSDWTLQGLIAFTRAHESIGEDITFNLEEVADWAEQSEFRANPQLNNARRLQRYIRTHYSLVASSCGLRMAPDVGGTPTYVLARSHVAVAPVDAGSQ